MANSELGGVERPGGARDGAQQQAGHLVATPALPKHSQPCTKQQKAQNCNHKALGQAIDGVFRSAVLQGRGSVVTDLVNVSAVCPWLSVNGKHVLSIQVLSSLSKAARTTGESFESNCQAILQLRSATQPSKDGYKTRHFLVLS